MTDTPTTDTRVYYWKLVNEMIMTKSDDCNKLITQMLISV